MKGLISPVLKFTNSMFWDGSVAISNGEEVAVLGVMPDGVSAYVCFECKGNQYSHKGR